MSNPTESQSRQNRAICLPILPDNYNEIVKEAKEFRGYLDIMIVQYPELFPAQISEGYQMKDIKESKKLVILIRRIKISGTSYTIRPSFVLPYMSGLVDDVEKALFLRKFSVPFWALCYVFGKDCMYWFRIEQSLGRNSLVGTTIKHSQNLPEHLVADEKHTTLLGSKIYVATTAANECILGASIAESAGEADLKQAYGIFKEEAQQVDSEYTPKTVNTDGWQATRQAWRDLFPLSCLILCFLHVFLKIRDRAKKKSQDVFCEIASKLWSCYGAQNKRSFSQRVRRLCEWAKGITIPDPILKPIEKLRENISTFSVAYDFPGAHRTSNMLDRLMQRMDRHLFSIQYFHGNLASAQLSIRAWALILNFAPSNPFTVKRHNGFQSPAERLNRFRYNENWLQNLLISASLGGYRPPPLNPL
jgi:hypothetical protein